MKNKMQVFILALVAAVFIGLLFYDPLIAILFAVAMLGVKMMHSDSAFLNRIQLHYANQNEMLDRQFKQVKLRMVENINLLQEMNKTTKNFDEHHNRVQQSRIDLLQENNLQKHRIEQLQDALVKNRIFRFYYSAQEAVNLKKNQLRSKGYYQRKFVNGQEFTSMIPTVCDIVPNYPDSKLIMTTDLESKEAKAVTFVYCGSCDEPIAGIKEPKFLMMPEINVVVPKLEQMKCAETTDKAVNE